MNICMIYQGEFPPNERIEKEALSLIKEGHRVFLLCNNYGRFEKHLEIVDDITVIRLKPTFPSYIVNKTIKFPVFFNPLWIFKLWQVIGKYQIDVLHVIDIPISLGALLAGRLKKIPVVADMWENYPEMLKGNSKHEWYRYLIKNYKLAKWVEQLMVRNADHVIVVVDEQKDRLIEEGIPGKKISVVSNTTDIDTFLNFEIRTGPQYDIFNAKYTLLYVGAITIERGLDEVIKALSLVIPEMPEVHVVICGDGSYLPFLKRLTQKENKEAYVTFTGNIPFREIPTYISKADVCMVPHVNNDFINTTIPNKIFQYMAMGKAVLVSNAKPLKRIILEGNCGFVFESGNISHLAKTIVSTKTANRNELGANGKQLIATKYNWTETARELIRVYRQFQPRAN